MTELESQAAQIRRALARLDSEAATASEIRARAVTLLRDLASLTVHLADTPETACELLESYNAKQVLLRLLAASELCHAEFLQNPKTGPTPDGGIAANGPSSVVVHLAWLIGEHAAAARMIEIALEPAVVARLPKAKFWDAYFIALRGVARGSSLEVPPLKLRGLEKYWFCCMQLAAAVASQTDRTPFIAAAQEEFTRLNQDARITDWLSVDGDGRAPVKWSLRVTSLLKAAAATTAV